MHCELNAMLLESRAHAHGGLASVRHARGASSTESCAHSCHKPPSASSLLSVEIFGPILQMGEQFFSALEARLRAGRPLGGPADPLAMGGEPARADDAAAEGGEAGTGRNGSAAAEHDGAALSRAEFEALVGQELRAFAYSRPHHALDFRNACSCATALPRPDSTASCMLLIEGHDQGRVKCRLEVKLRTCAAVVWLGVNRASPSTRTISMILCLA